MIIRNTVETDDNHLLCPCCGNNYLHQTTIEAYHRSEDADNVRATVVDGGNIFSEVIPNAQSNNPSDRRHGMIIHFYCETCDAKDLKLKLAQHKGVTFIDWEYDDGTNT